jgi:ERCC4-type nuclease
VSIKIVADMRESRSSIIKHLQALPDYEVTVRELGAGDYLLRDDYPVERKAASDFVLSIQDRRLFEQVARMRGEFGRATFIIEGDVFSVRSKMEPAAIRGALSYLATIEEAQVITTRNVVDSAEMLGCMARHLQAGLGYDVGLRANKPKDLRTQVQFLVEGFPGIGPTTAKGLLAHFGSVQRLLEADIAGLRQVPGVGEKTARQIRAVIEFQASRSETTAQLSK